MENRNEFNEKIGGWLEDQKFYFQDKNIQEQLFVIINSDERYGEFTPEEQEIMKEVFISFMKFSFIINNNPSQTEKLIQYLQ